MASPIVTLTTDFGLSDSYVGEMKGVILGGNRQTQIVDLSHDVSPQSVLHGHLVLKNAWRRFPKGTIHVGVVDPGVGTKRKRILGKAEGHFFVGPDNGLLSFLTDKRGARFWEIDKGILPKTESRTFEGRDVFAWVAGRLVKGAVVSKLGKGISGIEELKIPFPRFRDDDGEGKVIHIDRFGNLISNFTRKMIGRGYEVTYGRRKIGPIRETYADVPAGQLLALWNSWGHLEIAVRNGSAQTRLKPKATDRICVKKSDPRRRRRHGT